LEGIIGFDCKKEIHFGPHLGGPAAHGGKCVGIGFLPRKHTDRFPLSGKGENH
jgi:hypothetical protein